MLIVAMCIMAINQICLLFQSLFLVGLGMSVDMRSPVLPNASDIIGAIVQISSIFQVSLPDVYWLPFSAFKFREDIIPIFLPETMREFVDMIRV